MAPKASPDSLIHCSSCGEDYSSTYRKCPFCGARNDPRRAASTPPPDEPEDQNADDDFDDGYIFDGQDAFDSGEAPAGYSSSSRGGKRLAGGGQRSSGEGGFSVSEINWPRLITFLCSLIIIVAALVIVFTVVYPQLQRQGEGEQTQPPVSASPSPVEEPSNDPAVSQPIQTDPVETPPAVSDPPLSSLALNRDDITLWPGETFRLVPNFSPSDWTGTVVWSSSDESVAVVDEAGVVSNANTDTSLHSAVITASAGGVTAQCIIYCRPSETAPSEEPSSEPSEQPSSAPGGEFEAGATGVIVGADSGLRVRSGPGTSYDILASLVNGNEITIVSYAGDSWYQIRFSGNNGQATTGYIMGDYISVN